MFLKVVTTFTWSTDTKFPGIERVKNGRLCHEWLSLVRLQTFGILYGSTVQDPGVCENEVNIIEILMIGIYIRH